ncbi:hypothetical protein WJX74_007386 [Apatococcus lobatus]|uniref:Uncharacterized protein n=1 Tax=Apatococcus lobatus TaxID=904363 RepID=A0AAW1SA55_9CHLO
MSEALQASHSAFMASTLLPGRKSVLVKVRGRPGRRLSRSISMTRGRSNHTFEPLKATLSPEVFRLALEGRRLAEADARIQQAQQEAASRSARGASSPTPKVPAEIDVAETPLDPSSTDALISKPAFSEDRVAGQPAEAQPEQPSDQDRNQAKLQSSPLGKPKEDTTAQTSAAQAAQQNVLDAEQDSRAEQLSSSSLKQPNGISLASWISCKLSCLLRPWKVMDDAHQLKTAATASTAGCTIWFANRATGPICNLQLEYSTLGNVIAGRRSWQLWQAAMMDRDLCKMIKMMSRSNVRAA